VMFFGASWKLACEGFAAWHMTRCLRTIASTSASGSLLAFTCGATG
jgi:hypothetical protein